MNRRPFVSDDLFHMKMPGQVATSPDGSRVIFTITEVLDEENAYASALYMAEGCTFRRFSNQGGQKKVKDRDPAWSPCGDSIAFISDRSGNAQVWLAPLSGGEATQVTQTPKGVNSFVFSPDGKGLYFVAKEDKKPAELRKNATARRITKLRYKFNGAGYYDNVYAQIWYSSLGGQQEMLTSGEFNVSSPAPSPCGSFLAFVSNRNADERDILDDIWLLDLKSREMRNLTQGSGSARAPMWTPEGRLLYLGHTKGIYPGGYPELRELDLVQGGSRNLMPGFPHYIGNTVGADVRADNGNTGPQVSPDGKSVLFVATLGGNSYLYGLDMASGTAKPLFGHDQMCITSFSAGGDTIAVNVATPMTLGDIWVGNFSEGLQQVTALNYELFSDRYIGWPEPIYFNHADGETLEGWLIKPIDFEPGKRYPLVMQIHGGPHATYGNAFFHEFQMLAGLGIGVFYTNPRGSLGYGEDFARAVVGDWCGVDARDLQFMAEEAAKVDWVDEERFGVTGGSQGGYFTNWLIGHTDMFKAAVTQRSMSNLYTKYGVADNGWNGDRYGMGGRDLWDDEDFIMERSPIRYARNVKTPTLIIHSDMDFRCPLEQGEQWYVALKRLGVEAEMLLFHGENHELSRSGKPANRMVRLEGIMEWFTRYLLS